jgi:hypothetical protein
MRKDLLVWQRNLYPENHTRRTTLVVHIVSVPLFIVGSLMLGVVPVFGWELAVVGIAFMVSAFASQGWAHKMEHTKPVPFDGPLDFVSRFFAEQFVTFPRFVLSGQLARAWRSDRG